jgi:hypothetical protein
MTPDSMTNSRISMPEEERRRGSRRAATHERRSHDADDAERSLARVVAVALPVVCVAAAVAAGVLGSVGSALLVLASGALVGAIGLIWASVRTLSGDAALPVDLEALALRGHEVDPLAEEKRRVLRALKDVENEHALGKIDDADYEIFVQRYREEAKAVLRQMDERVAPLRGEAERVAQEYLRRRGLASEPSAATGTSTDKAAKTLAEPGAPSRRRACATCATSNEADATFCKSCGAAMGKVEVE